MRTWKQGVIGKIQIQNGKVFYTKCLKYPLLRVFESYHADNYELENEILAIFIDLSVLKQIERIGFVKLGNEEKRFGELWDLEYENRSSTIGKTHIDKMKLRSDIMEVTRMGIVGFNKLNSILLEISQHKDLGK